MSDRASSDSEAAATARIDALDAALPQTQCTRCGYADCRSYAQAIVEQAAEIDRCPPGGAEGIARLAALTGRPRRPMDPACGSEGPRRLAVIDEPECIGCTLCIQVCPVDCIVGASRQMHTVIDASCTGCELCVPACPVDCIRMVGIGHTLTGWGAWSAAEADAARRSYDFRRLRIERARREIDERLAAKARPAAATPSSPPGTVDGASPPSRRAIINAALARAKAARAA